MPTLLSKAKGESLSVAIEAGITNSETMPLFISRANSRAMALAGQLDSSALDEELSGMLGAATAVAAAAPTEAAPEEAAAEEEPKEEEEDAFDGLGDLFG
jgi:ribosomal protein L12E/L44/L45/RPP1/RPP2